MGYIKSSINLSIPFSFPILSTGNLQPEVMPDIKKLIRSKHKLVRHNFKRLEQGQGFRALFFESWNYPGYSFIKFYANLGYFNSDHKQKTCMLEIFSSMLCENFIAIQIGIFEENKKMFRESLVLDP